MTKIPKKLKPITDKTVLAEAVRRLNIEFGRSCYNEDYYELSQIQALARTLIEFGWKPPVDQDLLDLRELAIRILQTGVGHVSLDSLRQGVYDRVLPLDFYKSLLGKK